MLMFPISFFFLKFNLGVKNLVKINKMNMKTSMRIQKYFGPIVQ